MFWHARVRPAVIALMLVLPLCRGALAHGKTASCLDAPWPAQDSVGLSLKAPAQAGAARVIRVLVGIDECSRNNPSPEDARSLLMLRAGDASISVHLSLFAMEVSVGKDTAKAARHIELQLLRRYIPLGIKHLVFNIHVSPRSDWQSGRVSVKANEAMVRGTDVLVGREIAGPISPFPLDGLEALLDADLDITSEQEGGRLLLGAEQGFFPIAEIPEASQ